MSQDPIVVPEPAGSRDNEIRPFQIEGAEVRGRAVRLGTVVDQILSKHDYPEPIACILGELLTLAALLGSVMKYEGVVTVQTKSSGPVPLMVADFEQKPGQAGRLRGYAQYDEAKLRAYGKSPSFHGLIGSKAGGYLALTIDQGEHMERFQGITDLAGQTLSDVAKTYFEQSEQTPTAMQLACARDAVTGHWRAGGIMVQHLSRGEEGGPRLLERTGADDWNRAQILLETVKPDELVDPLLDLDQLLFRLYHEDGVRVFEAEHAEMGCRCSVEKIQSVIRSFSADDLEHMTVDGKITVTCEFCNTSFDFDPADFKTA